MPIRKREIVDDLLKHFRRLAEPIELPQAGELGDLLPTERGDARLADYYSVADLQAAFARYGVTARLRARGFDPLALELDTADPARHVLRVFGVRGGVRSLLGELFLARGTFTVDAPFAEALRGRRLEMLFIQWLRMEDPGAAFTPERPALPGQRRPGLGIGREVLDMFVNMCRRLELDGIMVCPEFAHNALLYFVEFRFLDPAAQGRFEALLECCRGLSLAETAWGVESGCVLDAAGAPVRWSREEMVHAEDPGLADHLRAPEYRRRADEARAGHRLRFDRERFRACAPLHPDGSPRRPES